jgi:DNA-nicking Smr family endonuclease
MASKARKSAKKGASGFNTPFEKLELPKEQERVPAPAPVPAKPKPRPDLTDDDMRVFEQAMSGVKPLSPAQRQRATLAPPPPRRSRAASDEALARADLADLVQANDRFTLDEVGETAAGLAPGVDRKLLQRLRAGDYPIEAELDLHRRSRAEAGLELERFLAKARSDGKRCVLVIHGKGLNSGPEGPVLLAATRDWLTQAPLRKHVLAFASAPPAHGGAGAMLVLLRRPSSSAR